ncbi:hypothetical protein HAX54_037828, partial [Datura stramonium]|nr:hypothetical protein [Datura stramonium]
MACTLHRYGWITKRRGVLGPGCYEQHGVQQVSMANPVAQINLPSEEMIEAQRAEAVHLVEEARLAEAARRVEA